MYRVAKNKTREFPSLGVPWTPLRFDILSWTPYFLGYLKSTFVAPRYNNEIESNLKKTTTFFLKKFKPFDNIEQMFF